MSRPTGRLGRTSRSVVLLAVLAVTTAWAPTPRAARAESPSLGASQPDLVRVAAAATAAASDAAERHWSAAWVALDAAAHSASKGYRRAPAAAARTASTAEPATAPTPRYAGRNHLWIPALGVSEPIVPFPCPRQRPPDHYTYRWGCAGKNNIYILGHASGVMKPLHDAYVAGRLREGMAAFYANSQGVVTKFEVRFWRITRPVGTTAWWVAPQPVPSMTLQTCFGRYSQWRLKVRLVAVQ